MASLQEACRAFDGLWGAGEARDAGVTLPEQLEGGDCEGPFGLPDFSLELPASLEGDWGPETGHGGQQAPMGPPPPPACPAEPAGDASAEPAAADGKQKRDYVRWEPGEEQTFYDVLKTVQGQKPEKCFEEVVKALPTKDYVQVRQYYYRLIKRLNKILNPECRLDSKNNMLVHQSMIKFWEVFVEKGMQGTHMVTLVKKPRKQKMLNAGVQKGVAAVLRNAELAEKRAAKRKAASEAITEVQAAPRKRRQPTARVSTASVAASESMARPSGLRPADSAAGILGPVLGQHPTCQQPVGVASQKHCGEDSSNSKSGQQCASLAKDQEVNFERQGLSTSLGVSAGMSRRGDLVPEKLELHLVPANANVESALRLAGYHPLLAITCRWSKSLVSIMKHIRTKWQRAIPPEAENLYFHADVNCPLPLRGMKWGGLNCDPELKIGDIHSSLQSPVSLRLLYSWEHSSAPELSSRQYLPSQLHGGTLNVGSILREAITAVIARPKSTLTGFTLPVVQPTPLRQAGGQQQQWQQQQQQEQQQEEAGTDRGAYGQHVPSSLYRAHSVPPPSASAALQEMEAAVLRPALSLPRHGAPMEGQAAAAPILRAAALTAPNASGQEATEPSRIASGALASTSGVANEPGDAASAGIGVRRPRGLRALLQPSKEPSTAAAPPSAANKARPKAGGGSKASKKSSSAKGQPGTPQLGVQPAAQDPMAPFAWQFQHPVPAQPQVLQQHLAQQTPGLQGVNADSLLNFLDANTCTGHPAARCTPAGQGFPASAAAAATLPGSAGDFSLKSWPSLSPPSNFDLPEGFESGLFPSGAAHLNGATPPNAVISLGPTDFSQFSLLLATDSASPTPRIENPGAGPTLTAKRAVDALFHQARPDELYDPSGNAKSTIFAGGTPAGPAGSSVPLLPEKDVCDLAYDFGSLLGVGDTPSWLAPDSGNAQAGKPELGDEPFAFLFRH